MTKTTKHTSFLPAVFACWLVWLTTLVGAIHAVSFESRPSFVFGRQHHPCFDPRRRGGKRYDAKTFQGTTLSPFPIRRSLASCQKHSEDEADENIPTGDVPKYWRTTPSGLRIVDDTIGHGKEWSEEAGMVARVRCETKILQSSSDNGQQQKQQQERVVFLESSPMDNSVILSKDGFGVTLLVVYNEKSSSDPNNTSSTATIMKKNSSPRFSGSLREPLSGMRVGGRRRVLIPSSSKNALKVRFVGPGAEAVNDETTIMTLHLEALEPPSSWNAMFAKTVTSGGASAAILLLFRPFLSPLGLFSFLYFGPLIIKKTVNGFAAFELYMDVNADTISPIKTLLEWKLKF